MDLTNITDLKELKSLAYDQLVQQQQVQNNLNAINQRIALVEEEQSKKEQPKKPD